MSSKILGIDLKWKKLTYQQLVGLLIYRNSLPYVTNTCHLRKLPEIPFNDMVIHYKNIDQNALTWLGALVTMDKMHGNLPEKHV